VINMARWDKEYLSHASYNYSMFMTEHLAIVSETAIDAVSTPHPDTLNKYYASVYDFFLSAIPILPDFIVDEISKKLTEICEAVENIMLDYSQTKKGIEKKDERGIITKEDDQQGYDIEKINTVIKKLSEIRREIMINTRTFWSRFEPQYSAKQILANKASSKV